MPLPVMTPEAITEWSSKMDADLRIPFDQIGVSRHFMAVIAEAGFTSTRMFASFAQSTDGVKDSVVLAGLDVDTNLAALGQLGKIQTIWNTAKSVTVAEDNDKAEKKVLGISRQLKPTDYMVLKQQFEKKAGKQKDEALPGMTILERMDMDLEEGEFRALRLSELPSKKEINDTNTDKQDAQGVAITLTASGARIFQSAKIKVPPPRDPEDTLWLIPPSGYSSLGPSVKINVRFPVYWHGHPFSPKG
jgi:hypothetical protein